MRYIILFIVLVFCNSLNSNAKVFYLSSSSGFDGYTIEQAQNPSTPWRTIAKLNQYMDILLPGDSVLFKRGDVFRGKMVVKCSGNEQNRIVFGSYGSGDLPFIVGSEIITEWTYYSDNIWMAECQNIDTFITDLYINGASQIEGRFPNIDQVDGGYLNIDTHYGNSIIRSKSLIGDLNWTGATAIIRVRHWILEKKDIQLHNGEVIQLHDPASKDFLNGYGFFIQNHINTLDQEGEWYYNHSSKQIYLYRSVDPNTESISVTANHSNLEIFNCHDIKIQELCFEKSSIIGVFARWCKNLDIEKCTFQFAGNTALDISDSHNINIHNNRFVNNNNTSISVARSRLFSVDRNIIHDNGLRVGTGASLSYIGIKLYGNNYKCTNNTVKNIGYHGIFFSGDTVIVKNNLISDFCRIKDDGGGIYTAGDPIIKYHSRNIEGNIILNGISNGYGTTTIDSHRAHGIYIDSPTNNVKIERNTVAHCAGYGVYIHNSHTFSIFGNTIYNNYVQLALIHDDYFPNNPVYNGMLLDNVFFSLDKSQKVGMFHSMKNDISNFGVFNHNYYCRPLYEDQIFDISYNESDTAISRLINFDEWQALYDHDIKSHGSPILFPTHIVQSVDSINLISNGTFTSDISGWNCWSKYNNCQLTWESSNKLDEGCLKVLFDGPSGKPDGRMTLQGRTDGTEEDQYYLLKFQMVSSDQKTKRIGVSLEQGVEPWTNLSERYDFLLNPGEKDISLLLPTTKASASNSLLVYHLAEDESSYWLDNLSLYKAIVKELIIEDTVRFLLNPTSSNIHIEESSTFLDVRGNKVTSISLQPYSSLILFEVPNEFVEDNVLSEDEKFLLIYPNPSNSFINLLTNDYTTKSISIIDSQGRIVFQKDEINQSYYSINISHLSSGAYFIVCYGSSDRLSSKFIIP